MNKLKIAVIMGGCSLEHVISIHSGCMILQEISDEFEVFPILITSKSEWIWNISFQKENLKLTPHLVQNYMKKPPKKWVKKNEIPKFEFFPHCDLCILALHGGEGEDGTLQKKLDEYQQNYTGSTAIGCRNAMDKIKSKIIYQNSGIKTPSFCVIKQKDDIDFVLKDFSYPIFLKNPKGGSSLDIYCCQNKEDVDFKLKAFWKAGFAEILLEQGVKGREFSVGIVDNLESLPVTEIILKSQDFFTYEVKYTMGEVQEVTPANLKLEQVKELQGLALKCHQSLGLAMLSRTDFILDQGIFYVIETNNLPGMSRLSILPQQVEKIGVSYSKFITHLIQQGIQR